MKNQYFGDINDYRKYGLLRALGGRGQLRIGVWWMLTEDDAGMDGQFTGYLSSPQRWRQYDPELYDGLRTALASEAARSVGHLEATDLLTNADFLSDLLPDNAIDRGNHFVQMLQQFRSVDLLFADPDNGLEVPSRPMGRRGSSKYLYWREVAQSYEAGHSLLIYQHFCREERSHFRKRLAEELIRQTGTSQVWTFTTPHVLFLLAPQERHLTQLRRGICEVEQAWNGQISVMQHDVPR